MKNLLLTTILMLISISIKSFLNRKPVNRFCSKYLLASSVTTFGGTRGDLQERVAIALDTAFGKNTVDPYDTLVVPTQPIHGDYQSNVAMTLTKKLSMKPKAIAEKIVEALKVDDMVSLVNITGPGFITLKLSEEYVQKQLLLKLKDPSRLGVSRLKNPQKIIVDFSSPNIAKEMHVGHLRSTILGDSLSRILGFLGHDVLRLNHVGDWGTQFGMLIHYLKQKYPQQISTSNGESIAVGSGKATIKVDLQLNVADLMECYRAAKKCFDEDQQFKDEARLEVVKLQKGDPDSLLVWNAICDKSRLEFNKIYDMLQVNITERGESFYSPYLAPLVNDLVSKGMAVESQGSKCLFIPGDKYKTPEGEPLPLIVQKSDGGFLYATTDLAAVRHRCQDEGASRILYITDAGQAQHFNMVFDAAKTFELADPEVQLSHVPFGLVLGEDGKKIKTRSGESVRLKELLDEAVSNAEKDMLLRIKAKQAQQQQLSSGSIDDSVDDASLPVIQIESVDNDDLLSDEFKDIAAKVGLAAVKYADLSMNRLSDYRFSFKKMLSLTGNTAPYMLYAYVRIRSIQRKAEAIAAATANGSTDGTGAVAVDVISNINELVLVSPEEVMLAKQLLKLEETLVEVSLDYYPNKLCDYMFELSQRFNLFYERCPVLKAESVVVQKSRTALCSLTADTLKLSLEMLGINTVEKL